MPTYTPNIIQQHAQDLYDRADTLVWKAAVNGALTGAFVGWMIWLAMQWAGLDGVPIWSVIGLAAVTAGIHAATAAEREVFRLRLEAQQALCQVMIERHTAQTAKHMEALRHLQSAAARS